jgi:hypothetical protein
MRNKVISMVSMIAFAAAFIVSPIARADEVKLKLRYEAVSPLSKGDHAPFTGILFSKDLAARIEAERKTMIAVKLCDAKLNASVLLAKSELQLKLDVLTGKYSALQIKHTDIVAVKDGQIEFLRKSYMPTPWYESPAFLITIGVLSGIGLSLGAAHLVKTVR